VPQEPTIQTFGHIPNKAEKLLQATLVEAVRKSRTSLEARTEDHVLEGIRALVRKITLR
jgi:hypothetical protein